jgi:hypothetical protein
MNIPPLTPYIAGLTENERPNYEIQENVFIRSMDKIVLKMMRFLQGSHIVNIQPLRLIY